MLTAVETIEALEPDEILRHYDDHQRWVDLANEVRGALHSSPAQSQFRVVALLLFSCLSRGHRVLKVICGTNAEQGYIGGAICAERAAICRMRFFDHPELLKVVVVTDAASPLTPGCLCREFLMSMPTSNEPVSVIMGDALGQELCVAKLDDLWPFPYLYRLRGRYEVLECAKEHQARQQAKASTSVDSAILRLASAAATANSKDSTDSIHPIKLSAAILFSDNTVETSYQLKGIEYGCTLDPVLALLRSLTLHLSTEEVTRRPVMLAMVDQFGVFHAPFAAARSLLFEHGMGDLLIVVADNAGEVSVISVDSLFPKLGGSAKLLSHEDFK